MTISIYQQKQLLPQIGQIAIYEGRYCAKNLRFRMMAFKPVGGLVIPWGIRVKWDNHIAGWVSFGRRRGFLPHGVRLFKTDDQFYFRDMRQASPIQIQDSLGFIPSPAPIVLEDVELSGQQEC